MATSSITDTKAREFLKGASERQALNCTKVTGLFLQKLKSSASWRYRYTDDLGKRRTATVGSYPAMKPDQAAQKVVEWLAGGGDVLQQKAERKEQARHDDELKRLRTFSTYLQTDYTEHQSRKTSGKNTLQMLAGSFSDFLQRDISTLTQLDIKAWQRQQEAKGLKHATIKRQFGALMAMLNYAARQQPAVIDANPLQGHKLDAPTADEVSASTSAEATAHRRMLTPDELASLYRGLDAFAEKLRTGRRNSRNHGKAHLPDLDAVTFPHWFIPFCHLALHTGMRTGDLYSLSWAELNLSFKRLTKTPEKTKHHPKPAVIRLDLPAAIVGIMRQWWEQQGKPAAGLVFPSPVTGRKFDKKAHIKPWEQVKQLGGLDAGLVFYSLRHHFISALVAGGVPLLAVARLAGHKGVAMIEQHYGHLCPEQSAAALQAFSASLTAHTAPQPDGLRLVAGKEA